jgi:hypothetical protein
MDNIFNQALNSIIIEVNKETNQTKIKINIVDPIVYYIMGKIYPYILVISIIFILTFIISTLILILILKEK